MTGETLGKYGVHPVAAMFPLMQDDELAVLAADIAENGLREPITVAQDDIDSPYMIVDGRNRFRACELAGVTPTVLTNQLLDAKTIGPWVVSQNLHRRHLSASQRASVAVEYERVFAEQARARMMAGTKADPTETFPEGRRRRESVDEAGDMFGVSGRTVRDAKFVAENDPDEFERVRAGAVSASAAAKRLRDSKAASRPEGDELDAATQRADSEANLLNIVRAILEPKRMAEYSQRALELFEATLADSLEVVRGLRLDDTDALEDDR